MKNFEFKSQICTSVEQSKRLLELGLKKGTADMFYSRLSRSDQWDLSIGLPLGYDVLPNEYLIPAWSLGRLIKDLMPQYIGPLELAVGNDYAGYYEEKLNKHKYNPQLGIYWKYVEETPDMFDNIISTIEWLIKEGYFNKDYLERD